MIYSNLFQVYDVSTFISRHPGGFDQIMLGAGRDITLIFDAYHPIGNHKWVKLESKMSKLELQGMDGTDDV